jgi:hypothetical protein
MELTLIATAWSGTCRKTPHAQQGADRSGLDQAWLQQIPRRSN